VIGSSESWGVRLQRSSTCVITSCSLPHCALSQRCTVSHAQRCEVAPRLPAWRGCFRVLGTRAARAAGSPSGEGRADTCGRARWQAQQAQEARITFPADDSVCRRALLVGNLNPAVNTDQARTPACAASVHACLSCALLGVCTAADPGRSPSAGGCLSTDGFRVCACALLLACLLVCRPLRLTSWGHVCSAAPCSAY